MGKKDGLSRKLDWKVSIEKDNKNQVFIKKAMSKDEEIVRVVKEIKKTRVKRFQGDEWQIEEN